MATHSETKTTLQYCKTSRGAITKGSVFDHQPIENKNKTQQTNSMHLDWIPMLLYSGLSADLHMYPEFLTTALMTMRPLLTHPVSRLPISFKCLLKLIKATSLTVP